MTIEAIYTGGVFKPLEKVQMPENQRVRIEVIPTREDVDAWLKDIEQLHKEIIARSGVLPDSTADIAEDRLR